ncbi:hypothetical protein BJX66DRAFT_317869 [Aspergillus keveii]|uniref:Transposase Tc1-like domain-containing protein n=1 Tax=Aspergillus keveii TaxID=714993 RepID=A0ABR4FKN1_9EURO
MLFPAATTILMASWIRLLRSIFGCQQDLLISRNIRRQGQYQAKRKGRRRLVTRHHVRSLIQELQRLPSNKTVTWNELARRVGLHNVHEATIRQRMKEFGYRRTRKGVFYHQKEGLSGSHRECILNARFSEASSV